MVTDFSVSWSTSCMPQETRRFFVLHAHALTLKEMYYDFSNFECCFIDLQFECFFIRASLLLFFSLTVSSSLQATVTTLPQHSSFKDSMGPKPPTEATPRGSYHMGGGQVRILYSRLSISFPLPYIQKRSLGLRFDSRVLDLILVSQSLSLHVLTCSVLLSSTCFSSPIHYTL
jgi:hypothetical protein